MVFNATFDNISVMLSRSVLLVEETGVPGENNSGIKKCKSINIQFSIRHTTGLKN